MRTTSASGVLNIHETYLVEGRRMAGGVDLRVTTPTLDFRPYAMNSMPYAIF